MLHPSSLLYRVHSRWRHLLHPLPRAARRAEWYKRDRTERNEAVLRRPYYTLKAFDPQEREAKRETVVMPGMPGPQVEAYGFGGRTHSYRPNYPQTWEAVPPHEMQ